MIELSYTSRSQSEFIVEVNLNRQAMNQFKAEIFKIFLVEGSRSRVLTWDNNELDCIGEPHSVFDIVADALGKSDLLGLVLPKEDSSNREGFLKLQHRPDDWRGPNTIKITKIRGDEQYFSNYEVEFRGRKVGQLENIPRGKCDGEIRELLIAAIDLVQASLHR